MSDVITVYRRIQAAVKRGKGVRLTWEDCAAIMADGAVQDALDAADHEA